MIDRYQVYALYKVIKKMWNAKRFETNTFVTFLNDTLENYLINQFVADNFRVEYMSKFAINLVNEINSDLITIEEWTMYVLEKCLIDKKCPELKDINSINKIQDSMIFKKRKSVTAQIKMVKELMASCNQGINDFADTRFSLYDVDEKQENQSYKLYVEGKLDPEFYIQGILNNRFTIDKSKIKDVDYKRFIKFSEMIIKLKKEISDKNDCKKI